MIHLKLLKPDSGQSGSIKMGTFTHCACAQAKHEQIVKLWGKISLQTDLSKFYNFYLWHVHIVQQFI